MYKAERQRLFPTTLSTTQFVKLYILHLLIEKNYYGNRLKDEITRRLDDKWSPSYGMIYPLLNDLEKNGFIEGWWDEPNKRSIKRYRITDKGINHYKIIKLQSKEHIDNSLLLINNVLKDIYKE
ncbi:MAG: PadR family transcriptional regulator [Tissierellia bacterium]|nr:PadR family transcriptional regulator [Tissierellia bacterium]